MKLMHLLLFCLAGFVAGAQKIQTIVPGQPVVVGTAFQVQYIFTNPSDLENASTPDFKDFTLVSGPNHYKGKVIFDGKLQPIVNITYTLVPQKTGRLVIPGVQAEFKNLPSQHSKDVVVNVVPKPHVSFSSRSSYTDGSLYAPSSTEDLEKLVNDNIFIKAEVSKTSCFLGEAIVASFKLYSRLQSSSELVRVPGLYGFSVIDILDIKESHQAVETIDGKVFNTSILRKVQLYPEQSGRLIIDEMVVKNEIEFDDSLDNDKKTIVHKELRSKPIIVNVKPLPLKQPDNFSGAVGRFDIRVELDKNSFEVGEQAMLKIVVSGKGNFTQLGEPVIQWPRGVEVFEPVIQDDLNATVAPAQGKRSFIYGIVCDSAGAYQVPPVLFSYFDPGIDSFKKLSAAVPVLEVNAPKRKASHNDDREISGPRRNFSWPIIAGVFAFVLALVVWAGKRPKLHSREEKAIEAPPTIIQKLESIDVGLLSDKDACIEINKLLLELNRKFPLMTEAQQVEMKAIRQVCQVLTYSSLHAAGQKESLKERALNLARQLEN